MLSKMRQAAITDSPTARACAPRTVQAFQGRRAAQLGTARNDEQRLQHALNISSARQERSFHRLVPRSVAAPPQVPPPEVEVEVDGVQALQVIKGITVLRGVCSQRLKYEIEYGLKRGTTDNSYLIERNKTAVLVDVPVQAYAKNYVEALQQSGALAKINHIVITQLDPKAVPTLQQVLAACLEGGRAEVEVVLSNPALQLLQNAMGSKPETAGLLQKVKLTVGRTGHSVLADGSLSVVLTPTPRWPDLMCLYDSSSQTAFTSKLFSAHVAPALAGSKAMQSASDPGGWEAYGQDWRYFFECMFSPQARQAAGALEKLDLVAASSMSSGDSRLESLFSGFMDSLAASVKGFMRPQDAAAAAGGEASKQSSGPMVVRALAPMHGPVVRTAVSQLLREYRDWVEEQIKAASFASVCVLYASAYGNTAALAQAISRGVTKAGVAVNTLNLELVSLDDVTKAVQEADGFTIGSPTLGGHMPTQVQTSLGAILRQSGAKELPCGVFGSFGWSGEAVDEMEQRLKDAGFRFGFSPIRVKFKPTAADLLACEQSGRDLATSVKKRIKSKELAVAGPKAVMASGSQLAMGRVVGSLSVVTAKDEDASCAMLASWIAQASFDPPGLTVAVKRDRAIDDLLVIGNKFNVSMVAEGKEKAVMKALTKPFSPGQDRLADLPTVDSPTTGCQVLADANSYVECQVASRMAAGDHYLIYATVLDGKVLNEGAPTAVHHRKVGNHY